MPPPAAHRCRSLTVLPSYPPLVCRQVPEGLLPEVKEHNLIRYSDPEAEGGAENESPGRGDRAELVYASSSPRAVVA